MYCISAWLISGNHKVEFRITVFIFFRFFAHVHGVDCRHSFNVCFACSLSIKQQIRGVGLLQRLCLSNTAFTKVILCKVILCWCIFNTLIYRIVHTLLIFKDDIKKNPLLLYIQGHPKQSELLETAMTDKDMQYEFILKFVLKTWDDK